MLHRVEFEKTSRYLSLEAQGGAMCKRLCEMDGSNPQMLMNISVWQLTKDARLLCRDDDNETAVLLVKGMIRVEFEGRTEVFERSDPFTELPGCLHTCRGTYFTVVALEDSEIIVEQTDNDVSFPTEVYHPEDCNIEEFGKGQWDGAGHRRVLTVFDLSNAPLSKLVMGEVFNKPGRWSSYPPHHHPQPEVYYYHFDKPQGFGACFNGDDVYKATDGSYCTVDPGKSHQQATAPGYEMYYCWMIRHLDGDPWDKTRIIDAEHEWLLS